MADPARGNLDRVKGRVFEPGLERETGSKETCNVVAKSLGLNRSGLQLWDSGKFLSLQSAKFFRNCQAETWRIRDQLRENGEGERQVL